MTERPGEVPQQDWEGAKRFPEPPEKAPVVFMLQPTHYKEVSTPEELQLWEQLMVERIGFEPDSPIFSRDEEGRARMRGGETISGKAPLTMDD
jgi:hypothetical protein